MTTLIAGLAVTASASAADQVYVSDRTADDVARYTANASGVLSRADSIAGAAPELGPLAVLADGSGLFTGQSTTNVADSMFAYRLGAGGSLALGGNDSGHQATGIATHPSLRVVYFVSLTDNLVHWRKVQPDGTAFTTGGGQGGSVNPAATNPRDVVVSPNGQFLYAVYATEIYAYSLNADGSINAQIDATVNGTGADNLRAAAIKPDGSFIYYVGDGDADADMDMAACPLEADGTQTDTCDFHDDLNANMSNVAVSPDGLSIYAVNGIDGGVDRWRNTGSGELQNYVNDADNIGVGGGGGGIAISADGRHMYVAHVTGGLLHYPRNPATGAFADTLGTGAVLVPGSESGTQDAISLALRPTPIPFPAFTATSAQAGLPSNFNATASSDPDGTVDRFDWDFGDGTTLLNAGPTPAHAYAAPGTYTVRVTTHDSTPLPSPGFTGHSAIYSSQATSTTRSVIVAAPPPPPAPPKANESIQIQPQSGEITVKLPGTNTFVPISRLTNIPEGSVIDATKGKVKLISAATTGGRTQSATFYDGVFKVNYVTGSLTSAKKRYLITEAILQGAVGPCPKAKKSASSSARRKKRRLWGNGRGRFRTRGRNSSATVRGTWWYVEDGCKGTLTYVRRGSVWVRDKKRRKTVVIKKGQRYRSWAPKKR
jgi:6-phosphogluconolactonase (cycloisomerase 2 family)